ncbi:MAG: hypothetical protein ACK47M_17210, partial [Caldilinea sp.]
HRISYDNLKVAVQQLLEGRNRIEQTDFVRFRASVCLLCVSQKVTLIRPPAGHSGPAPLSGAAG